MYPVVISRLKIKHCSYFYYQYSNEEVNCNKRSFKIHYNLSAFLSIRGLILLKKDLLITYKCDKMEFGGHEKGNSFINAINYFQGIPLYIFFYRD